jgi:hypothetical protein
MNIGLAGEGKKWRRFTLQDRGTDSNEKARQSAEKNQTLNITSGLLRRASPTGKVCQRERQRHWPVARSRRAQSRVSTACAGRIRATSGFNG